MPNPFDQFDSAPSVQANPFDQFDAPANKQPPKQRGVLDEAGRQLGLAGRYLVEGAASLPGLIANVPAAIADKGLELAGSDFRFGDQNAAVSGLLTRAGLPEPETTTERVVGAASRGLAGAGSSAGAAAQVPGAIARTLAQRPALQVTSGATGGASAGTAAELGAGPVGQSVAGLAGALTPAAAAARAPVPVAPRVNARADARAQVSRGTAQADAGVQATPEVRIRSGGVNFGTAGPDESAGLTASQQRVADRGRELGFRLTPGQATGSRTLQQLEAKLESQPMTSGPFNAIKAGNARVVNRAAARAIGENSDVVDDVVLSRASERIGEVFESVADDVERTIEPGRFVQFLGGLQEETRGLVNGLTRNPLVEDLTNFASQGAATGRQLSSLTSKLGKAAYKNMTTQAGDRDLGIALYRVKDYVDDALAQGLSGEQSAAFQTARQQYRNLMLLTQRIGVVNPASGNVSGRTLANTLQSKDKRGYLYGENRSDLYDAARFSQAFGPIVGDSGTATRTPFQSLTDIVARVPLNIATRAYTSSPAVDLAVRAQAAGNSVRGRAAPLRSGDVPGSGVAGSQGSKRKKPSDLLREYTNR